MPHLQTSPSMPTSPVHIPVLCNEVLSALLPDTPPGAGIYVDATFGRGGHSQALLARLPADTRLLAIDQDPEAATAARSLCAQDPRLQFVAGSFRDLHSICADLGLLGQVRGLLLDLGVSSPQLDDPARGFSFMHDGPLDMRMNPAAGQSVAQWLAQVEESTLSKVLFEFGEERQARRIARRIVQQRTETPLLRTRQLAELIAECVPVHPRERHKHPATRSFQALRIYINDELGALAQCLAGVPALLAPGGRLAVISFHSLEDRLVKRFIRQQEHGQPIPRHLPITGQPNVPVLRHLGKAIFPSDTEVSTNPRARSAVLRIAART